MNNNITKEIIFAVDCYIISSITVYYIFMIKDVDYTENYISVDIY